MLMSTFEQLSAPIRQFIIQCLLVIFIGLIPPSVSAQSSKYLLGWIEQVRLLMPDRIFNAKLDTGAETSSVDARQIKEFQRDEEDWVSFVIPGRDGNDDIRLEREIVRRVSIIQQDGEEGESRAVVELNICVAGMVHNAQFTLANREAFNEQFLLGRRLLDDIAIIDPNRKFLSEPVCSGT